MLGDCVYAKITVSLDTLKIGSVGPRQNERITAFIFLVTWLWILITAANLKNDPTNIYIYIYIYIIYIIYMCVMVV